MASLLEIGRSAINAQREALNVTGQNIVNANTEGYRRRDANLSEVSGLQSELTSLTSQTGLGVQLGEVRRSYDAFLTESKRIATGRFEASDAFVTKLERLENTILPNDGDLSVVMTTFFDALSQVAAQPGDLAPRVAAVEMGHTIGSAFNTTASLLNSQVDGTTAEIETQIVAVNSTLDALAAVNGQLRSSNLGANSPNSLLDERDRLIDSLSGKLPLSVTIGDRYDAEIRLGTSGSGPLILSGENAKTIDAVTNEKGSIEFRIGSGQIVSRLETGMLRGLVDAHGTIRRAVTELDALARDLTETMNAQHALGIDLDGQLGRELFSVVAFTAQSQASNQGSAVVSISLVPGRADQLSDMQMSFDARKGQWLLSDDSGALLDVGRARIEIDGAVINITGIPKDGDTISLNRTSGEASRMSFLLTRAEEFAAASTTTIYPDTQNSGSATITFARDVAPGSGTPSLADALSNNLSPVAAQEFLRGGVVGSIPRGTKEITLASLATQTTASVSAQVDADIISISVTVDGGVNVFSLEPSKAGRTAWKTGEEIADYLSMGVLRSESSVGSDGSEEGSKTLKELGITVSGSESGLAFASVGVQEFTSLSATSSSGVDLGTEITRGQAASDIRVFTREGRQIAGPPLQASEVAGLLTVENGFTEGAEYRSDYNTVNGSLNYRGMSVTQRMSGATALTSGLYSSEVSLAGLRGTNVDTVSETTSVNGTKGQTIKLQMATGATGSVSIPPGVDAAYVAEKANEAFAAVGVSVEAQTAVSLSLSAGSTLNSGNVQFTMSGKNQTPLTISAQINDGDMSNLVEAVNRRSSDTGVTAQLSLSGSAVTLVQADGFDLSLDTISNGNLVFVASALDQSFKPLSLDNAGNTSIPFENSLRFSGTVSFNSGSGFTVETSATDGSTIAIANITEVQSAPVVDTLVTPGSTTLAQAAGSTADKVDVTVGNFNSGESLSIDIDGYTVSFSSVTDNDGTATALATAFATAVSGGHISGMTATASGDTLTITRVPTGPVVDSMITTGTPGTTSLAQAAGSSANVVDVTVGAYATGDTLSIDIDGTSVSVLTAASGGYAGDEDGVAAKFAKAVNDLSLAGITAEPSGSGGTFTITKAATASLSSAAANTLTVATFDALETLSVELDGAIISVTNGAASGYTQDVNGTALMLRDAINGAGLIGISASVSDSVITLSKAATTSFSFDAAVDPMIGGLVERVFDSGGTQATLSYNLDNRIDGMSRNVDGTLVHAPSSGFATQLTMSGSTEFSAVVAASELENGPADGAAVARITAKHLRADAPVPSLAGAAFTDANIPPIGASARFELAGAEYTLTRVDDGNPARLTPLDFKITGPEDGRIVPHLTETNTGYSLSLTVAGGHLSGMGPKPVSGAEAAVFGLADTTSTASVQGRSVDVANLGDSPAGNASEYTISVDVSGVSKTITFAKSGAGLVVTANDANSLVSVSIEEGSSPSVTLTSIGTGSASIHITPSADAALLGFKVAAAELSVEGGKLLARSTNDLALDIKAGGTSAAGSYLHLTDIPDEELIVVLGDAGAKRLSATYEIGAPLADADREPESFRVEMMDEATGRVELFDMATGASIATRFSNGFSRFNVSGQSVELSGFAENGDNFELVTGQRSPGDSRNMDELLSFGQQKSGSRSFQDNFRSIVAGVGATLEAARLTLNSTEAVRDAAVASESELSGVNLDEEAAKLISQQQAYQAAARILQTALEMFETLIRIA
jgi:flagellar hook-associated protein 1 FlgK